MELILFITSKNKHNISKKQQLSTPKDNLLPTKLFKYTNKRVNLTNDPIVVGIFPIYFGLKISLMFKQILPVILF